MSGHEPLLGSEHHAFLFALEEAEKTVQVYQYGVLREDLYPLCKMHGLSKSDPSHVEKELVEKYRFIAHTSSAHPRDKHRTVYYVRFEPSGRAYLERLREKKREGAKELEKQQTTQTTKTDTRWYADRAITLISAIIGYYICVKLGTLWIPLCSLTRGLIPAQNHNVATSPIFRSVNYPLSCSGSEEGGGQCDSGQVLTDTPPQTPPDMSTSYQIHQA
jgi:hypothetical protein